MSNKDYNSINWHQIFSKDSSSPSGMVWKVRPSNCVKVGNVAGSILTNKKTGRECFVVRFNKTLWLVHRILWVMRNGEIDANLEIDHIDGNALNNSVDNLRLVSNTINQRNKKQSSRNSSGVTGVGFVTVKGATYARARWYNLARKLEYKAFHCKKLGLLESFAAACAYREKMIEGLNASGAGYSDRHGI